MTNRKNRALLVEDSASFRSVLTNITSDKADWTTSTDIASARDCLKSSEFDIIVLDLYLPDGNSIDLCKEIRANNKKQYPVIVFISGERKLEWRLRTYEAGADDFIIKNINADELKMKFDALFRYQSKRHHLMEVANREIKNEAKIFNQTSEDNAQLLSFSRQCLNVSTVNQLGVVASEFLANWDLDFCLQIKSHDDFFRLKRDGSDFSPIEDELFTELKINNSNIQTFGSKTYFLKGDAELIIKDMPIHDEILFGSLKDLLHIALCIMNDKNKQLELAFKIVEECKNIECSINSKDMHVALESVANLRSFIEEDESASESGAGKGDIFFF